MKKNYFILILGFCLIFTACKKEELVRLDADVEDFAGQKAYIGELDGGKYTCFEAGDVINVNGSPITITAGDIKRDGRGVTLNVTSASAYNAVFPSSLVTSLPNNATTNISVTLPRTQAYETVGNRQKINIPMCGRLGSPNGSIHFHNLCALLRIVITNDLSEPIYYDRIDVSNKDCALSGSGYINDIASATPSIVINNSDTSHSVALTFGSERTIASGVSKTFYVIIPEAAGATKFKISLSAKGSTRSSISRIYYEKTKVNGSCTFKRNEIHKIEFSSPTKREEDYYFSVSSTKKVIFSPGNLQWSYTGGGTEATDHGVAGGGTAPGTWRFAVNQWDYVGGINNAYPGNVYANGTKCSNANISSSYSGWIDLFGWGTSGYNYCYPYLSDYYTTSNDNNTHYGGSANLTGTNYDWGKYNDINNPVNNRTESQGTWYTLTKAEWEYIVKSGRTDCSKKRAFSIISGVNGLVILPDNFTYPSGLGTSIKTGGYTDGEWVKMENNGAVFMPSCGHRQGTGYTHGGFRYQLANNNSDTYSAFAYNYNNQWSSQDYKSVGHSVRLVKDYTGQ